MSNEQCWKGLPPFDLLFLTTNPVHYLNLALLQSRYLAFDIFP